MAQFSKQACKTEDLKQLWETVFGDPRSVTDAFFAHAFYPDGCFYEAVDGKVVSAFYLLPVTYHGQNGFYLYAAATLPAYRGQGLMGRLIREALVFAKNQADFVYLCPAEDSLYTYYARFGFSQTLYAAFVVEGTDALVTGAQAMHSLAACIGNAPLFLSGVYEYAAAIGCRMYAKGGAQFGDYAVYDSACKQGSTGKYGMLAPLHENVNTENLFAFFTMN